MVFLYLYNADQDNYGSIMKNLNDKNPLGNGQYPKLIIKANIVLNNHNFDNAEYRKEKIQKREKSNQSANIK